MRATLQKNSLATSIQFNSRQALMSKCRSTQQVGFTLVELLVALAISTVVVIAAFSGLIISRQGFTAVDASSQLRDNARFAGDLLQRLVVQTGYMSDRTISTPVGADATSNPNPAPNVSGFNNATASSSDPTGSSTSRGSISLDGSDVLVLRFQANETFSGSGKTDGSTIDCAGNSITSPAVNRQDRVWSVLHVATSIIDGEPSLYCSVGKDNPQPIIKGVETFQVLYGVDNVVPGVAPVANTAIANVPNLYLRADQMTVPGDPVGTNANWERVRSIRVGMVLRGPLGSSPVASDASKVYYPFGLGAGADSGTKGSSLSSSTDQGTIFKPGSDTRLRQTVTFTIHLRNDQNV